MSDLELPDCRILHGDVRERLKDLPEGSVQTCVTSPPYYGLRDYGTAKWGGGDEGCGHKPTNPRPDHDGVKSKGSRGEQAYASQSGKPQGSTCRLCGAHRIDSQIGLEESVEDYVQNLVEVFREVRRVLCDDGTVWLNLGDSYAGSGKGQWKAHGTTSTAKERYRPDQGETGKQGRTHGLKAKDLLMVPARVALALQADGWYLRSDIIWHKPNAMPESTKDRPTCAHEHIFLLTKSRKYYYDGDSIAEPLLSSSFRDGFGVENDGPSHYVNQPKAPNNSQKFEKKQDALGKNTYTGFNARYEPPSLRNKRNVWTVPTAPFPDAHFATFPPKLIEPCILAGAPRGGAVLDPFMGSGTTAIVTLWHGRKAIGIELNEEYIEIAKQRIKNDGHALVEDAEDWV